MVKNYSWLILLACVILVTCLGGTFLFWQDISQRAEETQHKQFIQDSIDINQSIAQQVKEYENALRGVSAYFASTEGITRPQFARYVQALDITNHFPGLTGIGYAGVIPFADVEKVTAQMKAIGALSFQIHPEGKREEYVPILWSGSPIIDSPNFGFDLLKDSIRSVAIQEARKTGEIAVTDKVILLNEGPSRNQAFLLYLPVHAHGMDKANRESLDPITGFIFGASRFSDLLTGAVGKKYHTLIHFSLFAANTAGTISSKNKFYDNDTHVHLGKFVDARPLIIGKHTWMLVLQSTSLYDAHIDYIFPIFVLIGGIGVSFLLFFILLSLITSRDRAYAFAQKITQKLSQSEKFLDSIIENIPDMIFVKDAKELRFVRLNKAGEKLIGNTREEMIGKNDYDFFPKEEADFFVAKDKNVLASKQLLDIAQEPLQTKQGKRILHTKKIPLLDESGMPIYLLGISEDITQRKAAEEKTKELILELKKDKIILEAAMTKDEFLSMAAHQLRTPLGTIRWSEELLLAGKKGKLNNKVHGVLGDMQESTLQMIELVNTLLDVSRIDQGKIKSLSEATDVVSLIRKVVESASNEAKKRAITLSIVVEKGIGEIVIDPVLLRQIIQNIVSNAIKYNKQHGKVILQIAKDKKMLLISCKDTGIGIGKEDQKKIFEKFSRAQNAAKMCEGTGLGLFVVKSYVENNLHGSVQLYSVLGKGTTITVAFPLQRG